MAISGRIDTASPVEIKVLKLTLPAAGLANRYAFLTVDTDCHDEHRIA
jgi:hypothetical protein